MTIRGTKALLVAWGLVFVAAPVDGRADPPAGAVEQALERHARAVKLFDRGEYEAAIAVWDEAVELYDRDYRFFLNKASALCQLKRWEACWVACGRARKLGVIAKHLAPLGRIEKAAETALLQTRALLTIVVTPTDAAVTVDGRAREAPYRRWMRRESSEVVVSKAGFEARTITVAHPIGAKTTERIALKEVVRPRTGALRVTGAPAEAEVALDGSVVCMLPECSVDELKPGTYTVTVSAAGHIATEHRAVVEAGETLTMHVDLAAEPVAPPVPPRFGVWKWVTLGMGVALTSGGAVVMAESSAIIAEVEDLNATAAENPTGYQAAFDDKKSKFDTMYATSVALTSVGGVALVTSFLFFVFDGPDPSDASATVVPHVSTRGGGVQVRF